VPLLRSWTPVESMCPCLNGHINADPAWKDNEGFGDDNNFGADSRSLSTCSPTLRASRCDHLRHRVFDPEGADMLDLKDRVSAVSCLSLWKFVEGDPAW
jgi:hypothetical protein